jgi:hypothetical protein
MTKTKTLLVAVALTTGALLTVSPQANAASQGAAPKSEKAKTQPRFRCRVGNGKGPHYVDSVYPCPEPRRAAR